MEMPIKAHGLWTRMPHFRVCSLRPCYQRLWLDMRLGFCVLGRVAETALNMVVDKPGCLEKRITDRRTEKPESPPFHVPAHGFRLRRNSGNLSQSAEMVNNGLMIGEKRQDVPVKTAEFFLNGHKQFRIIDSAVDFQTVFDNSIKSHQPFHIFCRHPRHFLHIKAMEGSPVSFALPEDSKPG